MSALLIHLTCNPKAEAPNLTRTSAALWAQLAASGMPLSPEPPPLLSPLLLLAAAPAQEENGRKQFKCKSMLFMRELTKTVHEVLERTLSHLRHRGQLEGTVKGRVNDDKRAAW